MVFRALDMARIDLTLLQVPGRLLWQSSGPKGHLESAGRWWTLSTYPLATKSSSGSQDSAQALHHYIGQGKEGLDSH